MMKLKNLVLVFLAFILLLLFIKKNMWVGYDEMMNDHMELTGMMWNSVSKSTCVMSLFYFVLMLIFMSSIYSSYKSRWMNVLNKLVNSDMLNYKNSYMIVSSMSFFLFLINFYSLFSFNWVPMSQSWLILILTTMFLLSIWLSMILSGGMKLFGEKVPVSWYLLNFSLWFFHNLSFFIRFISLPFRMMMNLIVGMFLIDFSKHMDVLTGFVSIYEIFVMMIQTLVFMILSNMYYTEMIILPEWKSHSKSYSFNFNMKWLFSIFIIMKNFIIKFLC